MSFVTLYSTIDTLENAEMLSRSLLEENLVACVNVIPSMHSYYHWEGKLEHDQELLVLAKTRESLVQKCIDRIQEIHPYDIPCITVLPIVAGNPAYLDWVQSETQDI